LDNRDEILVRLDNVSKIFCRDLKKSLFFGLQDSARDLFSFGRKTKDPIADISSSPALRDGEFFAVRNVSFKLRRGECLGLIGKNGAGKTTLLKMLNGLIKPDAGRIEMRGRIAAMIALGSGFNSLLTGRENIYVNGAVLGMTKTQIEEKIDDIIDFSELRDFINTPVQTYSSGMQVRLGFAVAVTLIQPDVLILDEVLAVGDADFRVKCLSKIAEITNNSATIFVSHDALQISRACSRAIWMKKGAIAADSQDVSATLSRYSSESYHAKKNSSLETRREHNTIKRLLINGSRAACGDSPPIQIDSRNRFEMKLDLPPIIAESDLHLKVLLLDDSGEGITELRATDVLGLMTISKDVAVHGCSVTISTKCLPIPDGNYSVRLSVGGSKINQCFFFVECLARLVLEGRGRTWCKSLLGTDWHCETTRNLSQDSK